MSPEQCRMARAALELGLEQVAAEAGVTAGQVRAIETSGHDPFAVERIRAVFEAHGIAFLGTDGVRLSSRRADAEGLAPDSLNAAKDD